MLKIYKLKDMWFKNHLSDQLLIILIMFVNILLGLVLRLIFKVDYAVILCSTIPNLFLSIIVFIRGYRVERVLHKTSLMIRKFETCIDLLSSYNEDDIEEMYKIFQEVSEVKLPDIDFKIKN